jgi:hypothetical protein
MANGFPAWIGRQAQSPPRRVPSRFRAGRFRLNGRRGRAFGHAGSRRMKGLRPCLAIGICSSIYPVPAHLTCRRGPVSACEDDWPPHRGPGNGKPMPPQEGLQCRARIRLTIRGPEQTGLGENDFPPPDPLRERFVCSSPECEGGRQDKAAGRGGDKLDKFGGAPHRPRRHSRAGGNPVPAPQHPRRPRTSHWIPAFAGMTAVGAWLWPPPSTTLRVVPLPRSRGRGSPIARNS